MVCSFTGHRRIEPEHRKMLVDLLGRAVEYAYSEGCRTFMTGGAIGFDTLAAREVIRFRMTHSDVRLVLVLPCIEQDAKWNEAQKESYNFTLSVADEIVYVSEEYTKSCMAKRNSYLAEHADLVIAYLNRKNSGAAQTVRMAESLNKRVYNLFPAILKSINDI